MHLEKTFNFLNELSGNNNREWFTSNKNPYDEARKEFTGFVDQLIGRIASFDETIRGVTSSGCLFRIYRDTRFSKDKTPYKTNFGAFIINGGRKSPLAGYYVHIEPTRSFLAGGVYMPPPDVLKKVRMEIMYNPGKFLSIINEPAFREAFGGLEGDRLVRPPKGFPQDFEHVDLLKYKSYIVVHPLDDDLASGESLLDHATETFALLYPFNRFINIALAD